MNSKTLSFWAISLRIPVNWQDITATVDAADPPLSVGDPDQGVGALQFSPAIYKSGPLPHFTTESLWELLSDFSKKQNLGEPFEHLTYNGYTTAVGSSFQRGGDFIRVWYCTDGINIVLATYICEWIDRDTEFEGRENATRSLRIKSGISDSDRPDNRQG